MTPADFRVAIVANTSWYLFNFRLNLMLALKSAGFAVLAMAPADSFSERIRAAGIDFQDVPISGGGTNPIAELRSVAILWASLSRPRHAKRIDLVFSYTPKGNLYSALACMASHLPFVANVSGQGRTTISPSGISWIVEILYRITLPHAHRVFFQNNDDLSSFLQRGMVRTDQAERLPGSGVDLVRFRPTDSAPRRSGAADCPVFLMMARLMWDKGVGEYVAAARIVKARFPGARFLILGFLDVDNPSAISRAQMEEWIGEGAVEYKGATDDVRPWIAGADCVVLPSYREGVPRTLLEAAAMACPVITTDAPGCRDTVIDGRTGFLCRVADPGDLAEKMLRMAALSPDKRREMGICGRALMVESFDEGIVLSRYLAVTREVADAAK